MDACLARDVQLKLQKLTEYADEGKWHNGSSSSSRDQALHVLAVHALQLAAAAAAAAASAVSDDANTNIQAAALPAVDGVALSNSAVCLLHMGQLTEAISCLEAGLQQHPADTAQECTLLNLGIMFDLAYRTSSAQQARRHIASSLMRSVPDDFDLAVMALEHGS
ncbi:hypothetical protein OEZ85_003404 [Tetradesmus obliquus]|uniref:Uncharacterized protein n=1 Tax=Tetradesmus obliquus TaxID=3088 RepID=A0ABY8UB73_TETOB|nr:hypothetical protein OEZ85_003404 [Tetradesmus obliquus]